MTSSNGSGGFLTFLLSSVAQFVMNAHTSQVAQATTTTSSSTADSMLSGKMIINNSNNTDVQPFVECAAKPFRKPTIIKSLSNLHHSDAIIDNHQNNVNNRTRQHNNHQHNTRVNTNNNNYHGSMGIIEMKGHNNPMELSTQHLESTLPFLHEQANILNTILQNRNGNL